MVAGFVDYFFAWNQIVLEIAQRFSLGSRPPHSFLTSARACARAALPAPRHFITTTARCPDADYLKLRQEEAGVPLVFFEVRAELALQEGFFLARFFDEAEENYAKPRSARYSPITRTVPTSASNMPE